jgi:hypothetical protein
MRKMGGQQSACVHIAYHLESGGRLIVRICKRSQEVVQEVVDSRDELPLHPVRRFKRSIDGPGRISYDYPVSFRSTKYRPPT